ncbi:MAG TPA: ABC transporter substrate-binding protein [Armatimonadetes bacterium]|nr:ABC transporter substrate-binding protein [Armatimonadota bacterium]
MVHHGRGKAAVVPAALAIFALLALLAGCPPQADDEGEVVAPDSLAPEPQALTGDPVKIGALFAVTGEASSLGEPEADTAKMLEKNFNETGGIAGRPVRILIRDTKGIEADALNAAKELVEKENVVALVGPSRSGTTMAVVDYVESAGVPLLSCAAARAITEPVKKFVFQVPPGDADAVVRIYEYMNANNISKIAILTSSSGYGAEGLKQLTEQAGDAGIDIVAKESFNEADTDMTAQLTRIKATDAQAVVCWGVGKAPGLIARNMAQLAMKIPLFQSSGVANQRFIEAAGEAADGVIMPAAKLIVLDQLPEGEPQMAALKEYHDMFVAEYNREPDHYGGHAWDALQIIKAAIERAGADADRAAIRDEIENTSGLVGIGGIFTYSPEDHYGLSPDSFAMVTIEGGKWKLIHGNE